ncbi:MAG TPA: STAS domain-containing protein [Steroidobacteraceae bacterium]|nr:STAS domain-containing protein [Steroidobacteraceae bacterium]
MAAQERLAGMLARHRDKILKQWQRELAALTGKAKLSAEDTRRQADEFFDVFMGALSAGAGADTAAESWKPVRTFLDQLSRERVMAGFSSDETAIFIFSLKRALFDAVSGESKRSTEQVAEDLWTISELLDKLGLHTVKTFQRSREEIINRQQAEMLELSTPVVKLWDGILALPLIGTLDSARTQVVMESLLQKIVETESQVAIIDITGVPTVDTLVAQHLLKAVTALRLMGADCIVSGVRPQIAQTIVHLGVDLQGVTTKANLADALSLALKRTGVTIGA